MHVIEWVHVQDSQPQTRITITVIIITINWSLNLCFYYIEYSVVIHICDPAWENRAYVYKILTTFWTLKFQNFEHKESLWMKLLCVVKAHNGKFNTGYRTRIAYTEGEECGIMWRDVFCVRKLYFHIIYVTEPGRTGLIYM